VAERNDCRNTARRSLEMQVPLKMNTKIIGW